MFGVRVWPERCARCEIFRRRSGAARFSAGGETCGDLGECGAAHLPESSLAGDCRGERVDEHESGDALSDHVGMIGTDLAEHGSADGMTGDHSAVDVELLEYGQQIGSRLVGADAVGADGRFSVPAEVVRDDSEAVGEVAELVSPQVVGERQTVDQYEWWTSPGLGDVDQRSVAGGDRVMLQNGCWSRQLTGRRAPIVAAPNDTRNRNREADDPGADDGGSSGNAVERAHRSPARPWSRRPQNRSPRSGTSSVVDPVIVVEKELNMMAWSMIPATCSLSRSAGMTPAADASSRRRRRSDTRGMNACAASSGWSNSNWYPNGPSFRPGSRLSACRVWPERHDR